MNENDFEKDVKAALDDIVDTAPKPPKWKWITAGYAPLQRAEAKPWYRGNGAAFLGAAAATILVVGAAAFIGSGLGSTDPGTLSTAPVDQTVESLRGIWVLDNYTTDGETHLGESSTEGRTVPWIEFTVASVKGFAGCNDFWGGQPPQITDGRLILGEVPKNAAGCLEPTPESVIEEIIWSGPDGVAIEITATTIQLTTETSTLVFERHDRRPVSTRTEWGVPTDDLACADGVALNHRLVDPNTTITEMLTAVPSVASVEERDEFEYSVGYDAEGAAVATVIAGDIEPRQYHRRSCASLWGIRSEANLGGAVFTWVNDLGLGQRSTDVWSDRFVEMCATNNDELGPLAERYISEDAGFSLWAGGTLPSTDQAAQTLGTIRISVCSLSLAEANYDVEWAQVEPATVRMGDTIVVIGQLAEPFSEEALGLDVWLVKDKTFKVHDHVCRTTPESDGGFRCEYVVAEGGDFHAIGPGDYLLSVGQLQSVIPGTEFTIEDS